MRKFILGILLFGPALVSNSQDLKIKTNIRKATRSEFTLHYMTSRLLPN